MSFDAVPRCLFAAVFPFMRNDQERSDAIWWSNRKNETEARNNRHTLIFISRVGAKNDK